MVELITYLHNVNKIKGEKLGVSETKNRIRSMPHSAESIFVIEYNANTNLALAHDSEPTSQYA
jgi:hypothetical protein